MIFRSRRTKGDATRSSTSGIRHFVRRHPLLWRFYKMITRRASKTLIILLNDILIAAASVPLALLLRVGDDIVTFPLPVILIHTAIFVLVALGWYLITQSYTRLWRTFSYNDLMAFVRLCFFTFVTYTPMFLALNTVYFLPRFLPLIIFFVQVSGIIASRYLYFSWRTAYFGSHPVGGGKERYLVLGNDKWLEEILHKQQAPQLRSYKIMGIVHRNKALRGRSMYGVPVMGSYRDLKSILASFDKQHRPLDGLLVADMTTLSSKDYRDLLELASSHAIKLQKLVPGALTATKDRDIKLDTVSLEDLLGRDEIRLDKAPLKHFFGGKRVLITGAGGSIGSELVRQVAAFHPEKLMMVDNNEYGLYLIDQEISGLFPNNPRHAIIADVTDTARMEAVFRDTKPHIVCHAAALKHVPMVEHNPLEGIKTNVMGTKIVADLCRRHGADAMVMVSTDKAVNPTNVMGATKRLAEIYCQSLDVLCKERHEPTRYVTVRFGNVLGSTGSVVPLFERQIKEGKAVTVTHPDMTRYFMTIREAVSLILHATVLDTMSLKTSGRVFVLDMGQPIKIADLARQMILLAGKLPGQDVTITYTGIRPGEKLYEELFYDSESMEKTPIPKIYQASPGYVDHYALSKPFHDLDRLYSGLTHGVIKVGELPDSLIHLLQGLVPEYQPVHPKSAGDDVIEPREGPPLHTATMGHRDAQSKFTGSLPH